MPGPDPAPAARARERGARVVGRAEGRYDAVVATAANNNNELGVPLTERMSAPSDRGASTSIFFSQSGISARRGGGK